jgi:hypothetical protein
MLFAEAVTTPFVTSSYLKEHPVKVIAAVSAPAVNVPGANVITAAVATVTTAALLFPAFTVHPVMVTVSPTEIPENFELAEVMVLVPKVMSFIGDVKVKLSTQQSFPFVHANKA